MNDIFRGNKWVGDFEDFFDLDRNTNILKYDLIKDIIDMMKLLKKRKKRPELRDMIDHYENKLRDFNYSIEPYMENLKRSYNQALKNNDNFDIVIKELIKRLKKISSSYERLILGYKRLCL